MARALLLSAVLFTLVLAGCASNSGNGDNSSGSPAIDASKLSNADALGLLKSAGQSLPEKYGMALTMKSGSKEIMTMTGLFDNRSGSAYLEIKGDASALGGASGGGSEAASMAKFLSNGITVYTTKEGSLYLANGTAFVFPPSNSSDRPGFVPSPDKSPLGAFMNPAETLTGLDKNVTVKSVEPTTFKGRSAVKLVVGSVENNSNVEATVIVYASSQRIAHVETTLPKDARNPSDPLGGATVLADFLYDNEVSTSIPPNAARALGLAYKSDHDAMSPSSSGPVTWTFLASGGVATSEVEAQVKDTANATGNEGTDITKQPTAWALRLSDGTKTQADVSLTFNDNDHDQKVSKGDTLVFSNANPESEPPTVVLYDTVTKTYVVPGPGTFLIGLCVVALALALRRK